MCCRAFKLISYFFVLRLRFVLRLDVLRLRDELLRLDVLRLDVLRLRLDVLRLRDELLRLVLRLDVLRLRLDELLRLDVLRLDFVLRLSDAISISRLNIARSHLRRTVKGTAAGCIGFLIGTTSKYLIFPKRSLRHMRCPIFLPSATSNRPLTKRFCFRDIADM